MLSEKSNCQHGLLGICAWLSKLGGIDSGLDFAKWFVLQYNAGQQCELVQFLKLNQEVTIRPFAQHRSIGQET